MQTIFFCSDFYLVFGRISAFYMLKHSFLELNTTKKANKNNSRPLMTGQQIVAEIDAPTDMK